jgi:hypothetical protein
MASAAPKPTSISRLLFGRVHVAVVILLLACGNVIAPPFISNQNQYFAHAVPGTSSSAQSDWFRNTVDPYPFFSTVARWIYDWAGKDGIRTVALFGTVVAMAAVFFFAYLLTDRTGHSNVALLSTVAVGLTLLPHVPHAFEGVAGQYIISTPAYLQPSMFGCFLLFAIACLFAARRSKGSGRNRFLAAAFILTALSCALHPTYIVGAFILLAAALIADIRQGEKTYVLHYACAAVLLLAIAIVANPALLSMAFSSPGYNRAVQRFAFERIPHHTRPFDWEAVDIARFVIAIIAVPIAGRKLHRPWLAHFLVAVLTIGLAATLFASFSGQAKLALLFPWRVSVFIMPISYTVIAVWIASRIEQMAAQWNWRRIATLVACCAALYGGMATFRAQSPAEADERTALVHAVHPSGVGLVPLDSSDVRLNAPADIYVDWESPPYASNDLIEWWRRVDQVRRFASDADLFCSTQWDAPIRWMLLPAGEKTPWCVSRWEVAGRTGKWRILEENQATGQ